ncbi:MAG: sugar-transfer associated ATP-grasp domain-containing protein [Rubripirellula sp.]
MSLKSKVLNVRARVNVVRRDIGKRFPIPIHKKLACWRKGFLAEKSTLYNFDRYGSKDFLSDYHADIARRINAPFTDVLTNKYIFHEVAQGIIDNPQVFGLIISGTFHCRDARKLLRPYRLTELLAEHQTLIMKPVTGGGGKGVWRVDKKESIVSLNGEEITTEQLESRVGELNNYLVSEFVEQSDFSRSLNPSTTNTIRAVTLWDFKEKKPFVARAVQRVGVAKSAPFDNFTRGGLSCLIDESGRLSAGASHPHTRVLQWHDVHPDSGCRFADQVIPNWPQIHDELLVAAGSFPFLPVIGWDLMLAKRGAVAIEGNHHPDPDVLQCHGPLLNDDRVKSFYSRFRIL